MMATAANRRSFHSVRAPYRTSCEIHPNACIRAPNRKGTAGTRDPPAAYWTRQTGKRRSAISPVLEAVFQQMRDWNAGLPGCRTTDGILFVAKGNHGVDAGGGVRRQRAGHEADEQDHERDGGERPRIGGRDAPDLAREKAREAETRHEADRDAGDDQREPSREHHTQDIALLC